jgi:hypothetical protein
MEFGDDRNRDFVIKDLARLYQTTQDDRRLATVAQGLGATPAEVQQRFPPPGPRASDPRVLTGTAGGHRGMPPEPWDLCA